MSGGSMDYLYQRIQDANFATNTPLRRVLWSHLQKLAEALHAVEWNDSGDGVDNEDELIRACLSDGDVLRQAIADAEKARDDLIAEINHAVEYVNCD